MVELLSDVHWSIAIRDVPPEPNAPADDAAAPLRVAQRPALFETNPRDQLKTASVGKLFLLAETMRQAEDGDISLDDVVDRDLEQPDDPMEDSGLLYMLAQRTLSVADLGVLIGAVSDNYATNLLIEHVGLDNVQRCARQTLGYTSSNLLDKVRWERPTFPDVPDDMSCGSADELCDYMVRLSCGTLISKAASQQIERWLGADADTSMVSGAFNVDPLAHWPEDAGFRLRHKTGTESDVRCDVGFVTDTATSRTVAYAVLANWDRWQYGDLRDQVLDQMHGIGVRTRRYLATGDPQVFTEAEGRA